MRKIYKRKILQVISEGCKFLVFGILHFQPIFSAFQRIEEVNMQELFRYDATVFGVERHVFLSKWLRMTGSHARVAIDNKGSIVGYTVARPTFIKDSYKIGPLFADSEVIAEKLLKAVFEELLRQQLLLL